MEAQRANLVAEPATVFILGYNNLPSAWPYVADLLDRACAHSRGDFTPESVVNGMRDGQFAMLALIQGDDAVGVMVVSVKEVGAGKILFVNLVGGRDMDEWAPHMPVLMDYAKERGCDRIRAIGRKGLVKKLPDWRLTGVVLEMAL